MREESIGSRGLHFHLKCSDRSPIYLWFWSFMSWNTLSTLGLVLKWPMDVCAALRHHNRQPPTFLSVTQFQFCNIYRDYLIASFQLRRQTSLGFDEKPVSIITTYVLRTGSGSVGGSYSLAIQHDINLFTSKQVHGSFSTYLSWLKFNVRKQGRHNNVMLQT